MCTKVLRYMGSQSILKIEILWNIESDIGSGSIDASRFDYGVPRYYSSNPGKDLGAISHPEAGHLSSP